MNFLDVTYHYNPVTQPADLLEAHAANLGYLHFLPRHWNRTVVKFLNGKGHIQKDVINYQFFNGSPSRLWLPLEANRFVGSLQPDVVLLHGLIFPQHIIMLHPHLQRGTKIIVQHHAEQTRQGVMAKLQRVADKYINAYLFATKELAEPWIEEGIIKREKVFQVMEGSSDFPQLDKHAARHHLQLPPGPVFLWVGSLIESKDPLTVLRGFAEYLSARTPPELQQPMASLYMIYQQNDLLQAVQEMIASDERLSDSVFLKGKMEKKDLTWWYNAADFFISGSHREGSGYALIEAMSCGCIPVVTNIPSFRQITANGTTGVLFNKGDAHSLLEKLLQIEDMPVRKLSMQVKEQFQKELSFKAIAGQLYNVCEQLGCNV